MIIFSVRYAVYRECKGQLHGELRQITIEATNGLEAARIAIERIEIATHPDQTVTNVRISAVIDHDTTRMRDAREVHDR